MKAGESAAGVDPADSEARGKDDEEAAGRRLPSVWNARSVSLIVLAVVMAVCAGAFGTGYVLYNRAAEPDRTTPGVSVRRYVDAAFNDRDEHLASQFTCGDPSSIKESQDLLAEIDSAESKTGMKVSVKIGKIDTKVTNSTARVTAQLVKTSPIRGSDDKVVQDEPQRWEFSLRKQRSGWRVCDARRLE